MSLPTPSHSNGPHQVSCDALQYQGLDDIISNQIASQLEGLQHTLDDLKCPTLPLSTEEKNNLQERAQQLTQFFYWVLKGTVRALSQNNYDVPARWLSRFIKLLYTQHQLRAASLILQAVTLLFRPEILFKFLHHVLACKDVRLPFREVLGVGLQLIHIDQAHTLQKKFHGPDDDPFKWWNSPFFINAWTSRSKDTLLKAPITWWQRLFSNLSSSEMSQSPLIQSFVDNYPNCPQETQLIQAVMHSLETIKRGHSFQSDPAHYALTSWAVQLKDKGDHLDWLHPYLMHLNLTQKKIQTYCEKVLFITADLSEPIQKKLAKYWLNQLTVFLVKASLVEPPVFLGYPFKGSLAPLIAETLLKGFHLSFLETKPLFYHVSLILDLNPDTYQKFVTIFVEQLKKTPQKDICLDVLNHRSIVGSAPEKKLANHLLNQLHNRPPMDHLPAHSLLNTIQLLSVFFKQFLIQNYYRFHPQAKESYLEEPKRHIYRFLTTHADLLIQALTPPWSQYLQNVLHTYHPVSIDECRKKVHQFNAQLTDEHAPVLYSNQAFICYFVSFFTELYCFDPQQTSFVPLPKQLATYFVSNQVLFNTEKLDQYLPIIQESIKDYPHTKLAITLLNHLLPNPQQFSAYLGTRCYFQSLGKLLLLAKSVLVVPTTTNKEWVSAQHSFVESICAIFLYYQDNHPDFFTKYPDTLSHLMMFFESLSSLGFLPYNMPLLHLLAPLLDGHNDLTIHASYKVIMKHQVLHDHFSQLLQEASPLSSQKVAMATVKTILFDHSPFILSLKLTDPPLYFKAIYMLSHLHQDLCGSKKQTPLLHKLQDFFATYLPKDIHEDFLIGFSFFDNLYTQLETNKPLEGLHFDFFHRLSKQQQQGVLCLLSADTHILSHLFLANASTDKIGQDLKLNRLTHLFSTLFMTHHDQLDASFFESLYDIIITLSHQMSDDFQQLNVLGIQLLASLKIGQVSYENLHRICNIFAQYDPSLTIDSEQHAPLHLLFHIITTIHHLLHHKQETLNKGHIDDLTNSLATYIHCFVYSYIFVDSYFTTFTLPTYPLVQLLIDLLNKGVTPLETICRHHLHTASEGTRFLSLFDSFDDSKLTAALPSFLNQVQLWQTLKPQALSRVLSYALNNGVSAHSIMMSCATFQEQYRLIETLYQDFPVGAMHLLKAVPQFKHKSLHFLDYLIDTPFQFYALAYLDNCLGVQTFLANHIHDQTLATLSLDQEPDFSQLWKTQLTLFVWAKNASKNPQSKDYQRLYLSLETLLFSKIDMCKPYIEALSQHHPTLFWKLLFANNQKLAGYLWEEACNNHDNPAPLSEPFWESCLHYAPFNYFIRHRLLPHGHYAIGLKLDAFPIAFQAYVLQRDPQSITTISHEKSLAIVLKFLLDHRCVSLIHPYYDLLLQPLASICLTMFQDNLVYGLSHKNLATLLKDMSLKTLEALFKAIWYTSHLDAVSCLPYFSQTNAFSQAPNLQPFIYDVFSFFIQHNERTLYALKECIQQHIKSPLPLTQTVAHLLLQHDASLDLDFILVCLAVLETFPVDCHAQNIITLSQAFKMPEHHDSLHLFSQEYPDIFQYVISHIPVIKSIQEGVLLSVICPNKPLMLAISHSLSSVFPIAGLDFLYTYLTQDSFPKEAASLANFLSAYYHNQYLHRSYSEAYKPLYLKSQLLKLTHLPIMQDDVLLNAAIKSIDNMASKTPLLSHFFQQNDVLNRTDLPQKLQVENQFGYMLSQPLLGHQFMLTLSSKITHWTSSLFLQLKEGWPIKNSYFHLIFGAIKDEKSQAIMTALFQRVVASFLEPTRKKSDDYSFDNQFDCLCFLLQVAPRYNPLLIEAFSKRIPSHTTLTSFDHLTHIVDTPYLSINHKCHLLLPLLTTRKGALAIHILRMVQHSKCFPILWAAFIEHTSESLLVTHFFQNNLVFNAFIQSFVTAALKEDPDRLLSLSSANSLCQTYVATHCYLAYSALNNQQKSDPYFEDTPDKECVFSRLFRMSLYQHNANDLTLLLQLLTLYLDTHFTPPSWVFSHVVRLSLFSVNPPKLGINDVDAFYHTPLDFSVVYSQLVDRNIIDSEGYLEHHWEFQSFQLPAFKHPSLSHSQQQEAPFLLMEWLRFSQQQQQRALQYICKLCPQLLFEKEVRLLSKSDSKQSHHRVITKPVPHKNPLTFMSFLTAETTPLPGYQWVIDQLVTALLKQPNGAQQLADGLKTLPLEKTLLLLMCPHRSLKNKDLLIQSLLSDPKQAITKRYKYWRYHVITAIMSDIMHTLDTHTLSQDKKQAIQTILSILYGKDTTLIQPIFEPYLPIIKHTLKMDFTHLYEARKRLKLMLHGLQDSRHDDVIASLNSLFNQGFHLHEVLLTAWSFEQDYYGIFDSFCQQLITSTQPDRFSHLHLQDQFLFQLFTFLKPGEQIGYVPDDIWDGVNNGENTYFLLQDQLIIDSFNRLTAPILDTPPDTIQKNRLIDFLSKKNTTYRNELYNSDRFYQKERLSFWKKMSRFLKPFCDYRGLDLDQLTFVVQFLVDFDYLSYNALFTIQRVDSFYKSLQHFNYREVLQHKHQLLIHAIFGDIIQPKDPYYTPQLHHFLNTLPVPIKAEDLMAYPFTDKEAHSILSKLKTQGYLNDSFFLMPNKPLKKLVVGGLKPEALATLCTALTTIKHKRINMMVECLVIQHFMFRLFYEQKETWQKTFVLFFDSISEKRWKLVATLLAAKEPFSIKSRFIYRLEHETHFHFGKDTDFVFERRYIQALVNKIKETAQAKQVAIHKVFKQFNALQQQPSTSATTRIKGLLKSLSTLVD